MLEGLKNRLIALFSAKNYSDLKIDDFFKDDNSLELNWNFIARIPEFKAMKKIKQSTIWHKEGSVWNHTKMVCENMLRLLNDPKYGFTDDFQLQRIMMTGALCHDLGKVPTTVFDEETQQYKTERHGAAGEKITRRLLWNENIVVREKVCYIVRYHMDLHHVLMKSSDNIKNTLAKYNGGLANIDMMNLMCLADSLGSVNGETEEQQYEHYDKVKAAYDSIGFSSELKESTVHLDILIGVPGSGKDTFAHNYLTDKVVLSRDEIREELGMTVPGKKIAGNKQQEKKVSEVFNKRLLEYTKEGKQIVISNTNLNKKFRKTYKELLKDYNPIVHMIYIEAPDISVCKERRQGFMPVNVIDDMWNRFEFPTGDEYDILSIYKQKESGDRFYMDVRS